MNILSIQSHVAYGHVGNDAATFPLQRMGVEVWPIHTVQFSNHTGYGSWKGRVFDAGMIGELVAGIEQRGVLGECDGVLSGYMGSAEIGMAILEAVATVRQANPGAKYCCDPVIGDVGRGIFVREGIPEFMRTKAVPAADIVTPNQFELDYLSGRASGTLRQTRDAVKAVHDLGPARNSGHILADGGDAGGRDRSTGVGCGRVFPRAHAETATGRERRRRRHRCSVFRALSATPKYRRGAFVGGFGDIRSVRENRGKWCAGNSVGNRTGRNRETKPRVQGRSAGAMMQAPTVFHIDRLDLSFAPKPWAFADERRAEIDAYFSALMREKPHVWNGRVLLMHDRSVENGVLHGQYLETDYASFSAWCYWDRPAAGVGDCFSAAAILAADGAFLLGVMGPHTFNGGRIYFPCGTPDPGIIVDGKVDLDLSLRRELKEETGLDMSAFDAEPGWTMVSDGGLIAQIKVLRSNKSATSLRERIHGASRQREKAGTGRYPYRARSQRFRPCYAGLCDTFPRIAFRPHLVAATRPRGSV